jgi:hypothetical protein
MVRMNKELIKKITLQIEDNPESWDQTAWAEQGACGTTFCVAGWACELTGYSPRFSDQARGAITSVAVNESGEEVNIESHARAALGLSHEEAYELFFAPEPVALRLLKEWSA